NAEVQAASDDIRQSTLLLPCNYDFHVLGNSEATGRPSYLLRMKPKRKQRFLLDGKIWVDMEDASVTRVDGEVAPSSFWVRSVHLVQDYERVGPYWLIASIQNEASVRLLGQASMEIRNFDYQLSPA